MLLRFTLKTVISWLQIISSGWNINIREAIDYLWPAIYEDYVYKIKNLLYSIKLTVC
jgi:hypothetical protein